MEIDLEKRDDLKALFGVSGESDQGSIVKHGINNVSPKSNIEAKKISRLENVPTLIKFTELEIPPVSQPLK
ncbi:hypothetical protein V9T40_010939 [Parthenolecanium corni]|uniref:Uncharacterized protein n=1 Tax=Parthenolecanium corni TaxID=536013 RepID=A0AAN9XZ03_9HEMI